MKQKHLLLSKKKRGITDKIIMEIGGLVFAAVLILLVTYLIIDFVNLGKEPEGLATRTNLEALSYEIRTMLADNRTFVVKDGFPLNIEKKYILVGFGREWDDGTETDDAISDSYEEEDGDEVVSKPDKCGNDACLCIYENVKGVDFDESEKKSNKIVNCKRFSRDITFLGHSDNTYWTIITTLFRGAPEPENKGKKKVIVNDFFGEIYTDYEYFFIYGKYFDGVTGKSPVWEVRNAYLEKTVDENGNIFIFIARESDYTKQRYRDLKVLYEFRRFMGKVQNCEQNMASYSSYSIYEPYFVEEKCSCGTITFVVPENYTIRIDNNGKRVILVSEPDQRIIRNVGLETELSFEERDGEQRFTTVKDEVILEGSVQYYISKQGNRLILSGVKDEEDECRDLTSDEQKAVFMFDGFVNTYQRSDPSQYTLDDDVCLINRFRFEGFPEGYSIKKEGQDDFRLFKKNESGDDELIKRGSHGYDFCYIVVEDGLKAAVYADVVTEIDSDLTGKVEVTYEDDTPKNYRPAMYPTFYLARDSEGNKKTCLDPYLKIVEASKERAIMWTRNRCRYRYVDDDSAEIFTEFINFYERCADNESDCESLYIYLEDGYKLELSKQDKTYLRLFYYNWVVNETVLENEICIMRAKRVEIGPPYFYEDKDVVGTQFIGEKEISFQNVDGNVCVLV